MKIAFPTQENMGIDSPVYSHFGSARFFIVVDAKTGEIETENNKDLDHIHGKCQPLVALGGKTVNVVVVGGIGKGALHKLGNAGIAAYRAVEGTVAENLELFRAGKLPEFTMEHTCSGHQINGQCAH
ncbi:MAG: diguanylate cyclase [Proteobacteria bacterium]|nr:diguanylate cyclase [Pseudomonadota bacterium]